MSDPTPSWRVRRYHSEFQTTHLLCMNGRDQAGGVCMALLHELLQRHIEEWDR